MQIGGAFKVLQRPPELKAAISGIAIQICRARDAYGRVAEKQNFVIEKKY